MPQEQSPFADIIAKVENVRDFLKDLPVENQNRLLYQAGSFLRANENLLIYLEVQRLLDLVDKDNFRDAFTQSLERLKEGNIKGIDLKLDQIQARYSHDLARDILLTAKISLGQNIEHDIFHKVFTQDEGSNLTYLQPLLTYADGILSAIQKNPNSDALRQVMQDLKIDELDQQKQGILFGMVARDLLLRNDPNISVFLDLAIDKLKNDKTTLDKFIHTVGEDLTVFPKNDVTAVAIRAILPLADETFKPFIIQRNSERLSFEEAQQIIKTPISQIKEELKDKRYDDIRGSATKKIAELELSFTKNANAEQPLGGHLANMHKALEDISESMSDARKKIFIREFATNLERSYLYNHWQPFGSRSSEKKQLKQELKNLIDKIHTIDIKNLNHKEVNSYVQDLREIAKKVKDASETHHQTQASHRFFQKFEFTKKQLKEKSKTSTAIDNAQEQALAVAKKPQR